MVSLSDRSRFPLEHLVSRIQFCLKYTALDYSKVVSDYSSSRQYAHLSMPRMQGSACLRSVLLSSQIQELEGRLAEIDMLLQQKGSKFTVSRRTALTFEYNSLLQRKPQLESELNECMALSERDSIYLRSLNILRSTNFYNGVPLPCLYPYNPGSDVRLITNYPAYLASLQQLSPPELPKFFLVRLLGQGGFSHVYKAVDLETLEVVALKISHAGSTVDSDSLGASSPRLSQIQKKWRLVIREASIYQRLDHPYIVRTLRRPLAVNTQLGREVPAEEFLSGPGVIDPRAPGATGASPDTQAQTLIEKGPEFNEIALSLELCENGDLHDYLAIAARRKHTSNPVSETELFLILLQVAEALQYLHHQSPPIIHNDISLKNIMRDSGQPFVVPPLPALSPGSPQPRVTSFLPSAAGSSVDAGIGSFDCSWKLGDFTLAKAIESASLQQRVTTLASTPPYCPPEKAQGRDSVYGAQSDMYSFGVVFFACFAGSLGGFGEIPPDQRARGAHAQSAPDMVVTYFQQNEAHICEPTADVIEMIQKLVAPSPSDRPTADDVVSFLEGKLKGMRRKQNK